MKTQANAKHTAGEISVEHANIFLSEYISRGATEMTFSPDINNNPCNSCIQLN